MEVSGISAASSQILWIIRKAIEIETNGYEKDFEQHLFTTDDLHIHS